MPPQNHRYDTLDALRALACFLVIWQHVSESLRRLSSGGLWTSQVADYFDFGRIGVVAFFCISGFVIPYSLKGPRFAAVRKFAINRVLRLYPIYWIALAVGVLIFYSAASPVFKPLSLVANASMLATFFDLPHVMGLMWTLEVELVFYVSSALLYLIFAERRFEAACCGFLVAHYVWKNDLLLYQQGNLPMYGFFMCIMFGASALRCVYEASKNGNKALSGYHYWRPRVEKAIVAFMLYKLTRPLITAIEKSFVEEDPVWNRYGWGHLLGIALFALFCWLPKTPRLFSILGRATYSTYLFHAIVFTLIGRAWTSAGFQPFRLEGFIILSALVSFAVAYPLYQYVERPCIKLGKRLTAGKAKAS